MDPIPALCTALAQATGGVYHVDLKAPDGVPKLAEVVDLVFSKRIVSAEVRDGRTYIYGGPEELTC